jgi:predicted RNA-binding protein associated with RNAse of E/G family
MAQVQIHYHRIVEGTTIYTEELVADDGRRLQTFVDMPEERRRLISEQLWGMGVLPRPQVVAAIRKYYFYNEPFDVLAFYDTAGRLAGYYSDVGLPLTRSNGEYHMTDLFLDLWLTPGGAVHELDWDEFEAACAAGALTPELQAHARATLARLLAEIKAGVYPARYID